MSAAPKATGARPRPVAYRQVGVTVETCSHGCEHEVAYTEAKRLTDTGETRPYDNGYDVADTGLYADAQGRIYHAQPPIDFYGGTSYVRDTDGQRYSSRLPSKPTRDLTGRPLTDRLVPGPSWSLDLPQPKKRGARR